MNINVKSSDAACQVAADASWTVLQLKEAIAKEIGVAASGQKLTVGGKIMKDAKTLADYPAAGSQAVSLVVAGGAAPAKAAAASDPNKSGERKQVEGMVNDLISMIKKNKEANAMYEKYGKDTPDTKDLQAALGVDGLESVKQKVLNELTEVLEGDWTVFEQYHAPLRTYGMQLLGRDEVSDETRTEWVNTAARKALEKFAEYPNVKESIEKECKPGRNLVEEMTPTAKLMARRLMDLFLDGPDPQFKGHETFSSQLRLLLVTTVGASMDIVIDVLKDGQPQCQQLMAKLTGLVIEKMSQKMPDYNTLFAFAGPMAMNQLMEWHQEYQKDIKGKSYNP